MVWLIFFKIPALEIIQPPSNLKAGQVTQVQSLHLTHPKAGKGYDRLDVRENAKS